MAYKVIILYRLYMPSYFLGTFTEYPYFEYRYKTTSATNKFLLFSALVFNCLIYPRNVNIPPR